MKSFDETKEAIATIAKVLKEMPQSVQEKAFDLLVASFLDKESHDYPPLEAGRTKTQPAAAPAQPKKETRKKVNVSKESFQLDKNLNLTGGERVPSFRDFVMEKAPKSNIHFTVVAVYYLKKHLALDNVTIDHVYTCYKDAGRKAPGNLQQNLYDVSSKRHGYIDLKSLEDIGLPTRGESFVEHDLPVKQK